MCKMKSFSKIHAYRTKLRKFLLKNKTMKAWLLKQLHITILLSTRIVWWKRPKITRSKRYYIDAFFFFVILQLKAVSLYEIYRRSSRYDINYGVFGLWNIKNCHARHWRILFFFVCTKNDVYMTASPLRQITLNHILAS